MKLYVSDLDGTLLQNNATLSEFSKQTLRDLIKQGVHFTVASARSVVSIRNFLESIVPELYELVEEHKCGSFISSFNGNENCLYYSSLHNKGMDWYYNTRVKQKDPRLRHIHDLKDTFNDQVVCLTIIDRKENLLKH